MEADFVPLGSPKNLRHLVRSDHTIWNIAIVLKKESSRETQNRRFLCHDVNLPPKLWVRKETKPFLWCT